MLSESRPTVCVTCAGAGTAKPSNRVNAEARKLLEIAADSPASGARGVGRGYVLLKRLDQIALT